MTRYISAVHYTENYKGHIVIQKVQVRTYNSLTGTYSAPTTWTRQAVVDAIEDFDMFFTIVKTSVGTFKLGDSVRVVKIDNIKYIRTDGNTTEADNLGELDTF